MSIGPTINEAARHLRFLEAASKRWPDLEVKHLIDGSTILISWLAHEHTTNFDLVVSPRTKRADAQGHFVTYLEMRDEDGSVLGRVYSARPPEPVWSFLHSLRERPKMTLAITAAVSGKWDTLEKLLPEATCARR